MTEHDESNKTSLLRAGTEAARSHSTLRYVEFYAGVGGWTMALMEAVSTAAPHLSLGLHCCAALDHSHLCVDVYHFNHSSVHPPPETNLSGGHDRTAPISIENLTVQHLLEYNADIWVMSPPCQPHSRQHKNQAAELEDPRSASFLHLCHLLETLPSLTATNSSTWDGDATTAPMSPRTATGLPCMILLENVVGFERSASCQRFRRVLKAREYRVGHFHLQPTQVGLPNDRPRYYCVALLASFIQGEHRDAPGHHTVHPKLQSYFVEESESVLNSTDESLATIIQISIPELGVLPEKEAVHQLPSLERFLDTETGSNEQALLLIPSKVLQSTSSWCMDIVTKESRRSACFTSGYGKFVRGTGSVLYRGREPKRTFCLVEPTEREFDATWSQDLVADDLRYFSGTEISRLLGFPTNFGFPPHVTLKQQWKLLGNSLNVRVASRLMELALLVGGYSLPPDNPTG